MNLPIIQPIIIILSIVFSFIWANDPLLSPYTLQLIGILLISHLLYKRLTRSKSLIKTDLNISNVVTLTIITILLVLSTGGLNSPIFFLLYLLLFSLSLLTHSLLSLVASLTIIILFLLISQPAATNQLINLISLLLITPLAHLFGTQYLKLLEEKQQIKILKTKSKHLKKQLAQEETSTLLWISLNFYNKMHQSIDTVSQLSSSLANIPYRHRLRLKQTLDDLKELLKSGQELEKQIDHLTDDEN